MQEKKSEGRIVRILSRDISGDIKLYPGLAKIKGVSWSLSNAACKILGMDRERKIETLTEKEIEKIVEFFKNPTAPKYLINRRADFETGKDRHLVSSDLELQKEFDLKRLKKVKSYRGLRHSVGLPTRGQRTRSNFRKNRRRGAGIKKKVK